MIVFEETRSEKEYLIGSNGGSESGSCMAPTQLILDGLLIYVKF